MSDDHHAEEQEMEAEALAAIFDTHFGSLPLNDDESSNSKYNHHWFIEIYPETASDPEELDKLNHVAVKLLAKIPNTYPEGDDNDNDGGCLPELKIEILKGLVSDPHEGQLLELAQEEAVANQGLPSMYAIVERLREWLVEHNRPGLDDVSMYAQMQMRKAEEEKAAQQEAAASAAAAAGAFESHLQHDQMTAAEREELEVRKRRAEGTPCNKENFEAWKAKFDEEMAAAKKEAEANAESGGMGKSKKKGASSGGVATPASASTIDRKNRITGFEFFNSKATSLEALEALEAAAEQAEDGEMSDDGDNENGGKEQDYNEELFEDDVDLDDLDFDDDDDDDDDDEPNI